MSYKDIITIEPNKRGGKPCVRGMRMTIEDVLGNFASGMSEDELLEEFPYLTEDDIIACPVYGGDGEDVSAGIRKMQNVLAMKKTPQERVEISCKMTMAAREMFLQTLPKDLPEREVKERLYFHLYGEHLPEDFLDRCEK